MNFESVAKILESRGEPAYRMKQIKQAVFVNLIENWDEATNLGKDLREALAKDLGVSSVKAVGFAKSEDSRTEKVLLELFDGEKIESVLIKSDDGHRKSGAGRNTVCVSSQAGCSLACAFCATGKMGCKRNLTYEEIVDQVLYFARELKKADEHITNIVIMGMGEPFLNYDNVMKALRTLNENDGFNMGARNMSVSTSGIIPGIERFSHENFQVNLAISLHAPTDELRSELMPINRKYHLKDVMKAVEEYIKLTNRKVFFEYLLIDGVNDSTRQAEELVKLMSTNHLYHVNLIKYNVTPLRTASGGKAGGTLSVPKPTPSVGGKFRASPYERRENFKKVLEQHKISVTFRVSFGEDISAACGQLVSRG